QIAQTNRLLSHGKLDTVFLTTSMEYAYLSSSAVKEIATFGGDISPCVPPSIEAMVVEKYREKRTRDKS
ncbi:MAG: pantetheine-phosphate adenylyltransferase, partial [Lachnospiraceae bacterium]